MAARTILNLHRLYTTNIGDLASTPIRYFSSLYDAIELDLLGYSEAETSSKDDQLRWIEVVSLADVIIVGGGGLLGLDFFDPGLRRVFELKSSACKVVIWGAGHNSWEIGNWRALKYELDLSDMPLDLVGVRDHNQKYDWVPCASCMHELFDSRSNMAIERDVGMYVHADSFTEKGFNTRLPGGLEMLDNNSDFSTVIKYLGSSELIITDSFHGAYWATLLGRKVIAFPSSSKFYDLKYPIPLCDPKDWERYRKVAQTYPEALSECRSSNLEFASRVNEILES